MYEESPAYNFMVSATTDSGEPGELTLNISAVDILSAPEHILFGEKAILPDAAEEPLSISQTDMTMETQSGIVVNSAVSMIEPEEQDHIIM
jgi:hypothetical protein